MKYNENDWIIIIDNTSNEIIAAGKILNIKYQGLVSLDCKYFFKENYYRYKIIENSKKYNKECIIPKDYIFSNYCDNNFSLADIVVEHTIDELDPECINLVNSLNKIEGIQTKGSCSGHKQKFFWITFLCDISENNKYLKTIMLLDKLNKINGNMFKIYPFKNEYNANKNQRLMYKIQSKLRGKPAYIAANKLAKSIEMIIDN